MDYTRIPRYQVSDNKYRIDFPTRPYVSEDLMPMLMETSREYREMIYRHLMEKQQLFANHSTEMLSFHLNYYRLNKPSETSETSETSEE